MKSKLAALLKDNKFKVYLLGLLALCWAKFSGSELSPEVLNAVDTALTIALPLLVGWLAPQPKALAQPEE